MILLFAALAVGRAWSVELVVTDPTVGGVLTVPADGAELSIRLGEPSGPHIPVLREVVVRRFGDAATETLAAASWAQTQLDSVEIRLYVPHPTQAGQRLLSQSTVVSPAYLTSFALTVRAAEPSAREQLTVDGSCFRHTAYAYDASGALLGQQTAARDFGTTPCPP